VPPLITLTTDFGTRDAYVAAMKGTIASMLPDCRIIDITHDIAPQDVMEAAFVLRQAVPYFPADTIHVAVVDPGVGTNRRAVAMQANEGRFVGPDNGLFALVLDEQPETLVELTRPAFWRIPDPSPTFHGRDVFAPVAAHLASGVPFGDMGDSIDALTPLHWALPIVDEQGFQGWIVHIDRFGNCITNVPFSHFEELRRGRGMKCIAGGVLLREVAETYATAEIGEPVLVANSAGLLEVAVNGGSAEQLFGIRKGASVKIVFSGD
jgi:S-adenosyl-L-methionine hydrolase (adenosine-forming)